MRRSSRTHLVLIPSYNPGVKALDTVQAALAHWSPVWVVVDGSTDGSAAALAELARARADLKVLQRPKNGGKGAAVLDGLRAAMEAGFTHILTMDADGQHPAELIGEFMAVSEDHPEAMVLGAPRFDASAPRARVLGRQLSNGWANLETLWAGIPDSLFGFRVYPAAPLRTIMEGTRWMRRFDFDVEAVVRLSWHGVPAIGLIAPVRYFTPAEGGVSHFRYGRDNLLLTGMHMRLLCGFLLRLPLLAARALRGDRAQADR